jgi:phosphoribosylaminoimidazole-succinocarboxamide synthase
MPNPIPGKGEILTSLSNFWFDMMSDLVPNHLTKLNINSYISDKREIKILEKRSIIVKKLKPLPIESVVRGYLIGSGWRDYEKNSAICGIKLPKNLNQAQKLPEIIYTPATKAAAGDHDINIDYEMTESLIGKELAKRVKEISIDIYKRAFDYAISRGIIIADTKFEFGLDDEENLYLIDEILTPDSSRFWPKDSYKVGVSPPSYDKQYLRDYLDTLSWEKVAPGPDLPDEIIQNTYQKYLESKQILAH